jgi:hypothetical protein
VSHAPATPTELRRVYQDTPGLRLVGIDFETACAMKFVRWAMERRALARRLAPTPQLNRHPNQPTLI